MSASRYYIRVRSHTLGPYALGDVQQMVRKAQIGRSSEVSTDGSSWGPASGFPEIFERPEAVVGELKVSANTDSDPLGFDNLLGNGEAQSPTSSPRSLMWHYTINGQQQSSPIDQQALVNLIVAGHVGPHDSVWNETMANWAKVTDVTALATFAIPPVTPMPVDQTAGQASGGGKFTIYGERAADYDGFVAKRVPAGVIALFLGNLGIHKFMLGLTTAGITMLILFFLIIPIPVLAVISLIEGIVYLTKSDAQFYQDYAINRKQWF